MPDATVWLLRVVRVLAMAFGGLAAWHAGHAVKVEAPRVALFYLALVVITIGTVGALSWVISMRRNDGP